MSAMVIGENISVLWVWGAAILGVLLIFSMFIMAVEAIKRFLDI